MSADRKGALPQDPDQRQDVPQQDAAVMGHVVMPNNPPQPNGEYLSYSDKLIGDSRPGGFQGGHPGAPSSNYGQPPGYYPPPGPNAQSYGVNGNAPNDNFSPPSLRDWNHGLCVCCSDCNSCVEACFCFYPQLSRQYNMTMGDRTPTINWCMCCGGYWGDVCCGGLVSVIIVFMLRGHLRTRYNISGSDCNDGCVALFCTGCTLQQMLLEMINCNMFPGACCYDVPIQRTML